MPYQLFEPFLDKTPRQLLESIPLANAFNPSQQEIFADYLKAFIVPKNTFLIEENKPNDFLYFICQGSLNVIKRSAQGEKILKVLIKGEVIGEASFFDHAPCSASLVATEESVILVLDRMNYIKLSNESPHCALALALELLRLLTRRLRATSETLINLL
jgi:CRP/FNR family transcriptional regulator/CRP/FNR family cyclic AMP-dependent transcriptional regulator